MSPAQVNILLVDDHPENLLALEAVLGKLGENLVRANSGEEALRCLLDQEFAVILLDVQMPGIDGFETAALIRRRARSRQTPIIFLTAFSTSEKLMFKGYALGAVDYLHKPIDPVILTSKVTVFVELFKKTQVLEQQTAQLEATNSQLKRSEEQFRSLSACSPVGIFVTDTQGGCTYMNPRCRAICGLDAATHQDWLAVVHPDDRATVLHRWETYLQDSYDFSAEFRLRAQEQMRLVQVRSSPMLSDYGEALGHVGTIEDISDRKQAEVDRAQVIQEQAARREAEAANRMKDEFLAVLSHELRTPLNSMLGWARLLRTRKFDADTTARALETIERNANTQSQLIEDILDVSKIIRGKLRLSCGPLSLTSVIQAAIDSVRPLAEANAIEVCYTVLEAETTDQTPGFTVWGDPVRLQQIVWNLLTNAVKFTPEGGRVDVKLSTVRSPQPLAKIQISDTGIGISPEFLPNVFDRFRQADSTTTRSHNGLGLGLAIVRHLVELHSGTVTAASSGEGQGAVFTVTLPLWQPDTDLLPDSNQAVSELSLNGLRVLLVDDEPDTREVLAVMLQQSGAIVTTAASASEALSVLTDLKPDVLVSDISMPQEDGYDLIRKVRGLENHEQTIPAVALTANTREEDRQHALSAGFQAHVAKPVQTTALIEAIGRIVRPQRSVEREKLEAESRPSLAT